MSIKTNFLYNSILTLSQYVIALITFPYISHKLGVSNIGTVGFIDNTINYFTLFASMGINILGVREVAKYRNNQTTLNSVFSSLLIISIILTLITLSIYLYSIVNVEKFSVHKEYFYIGTAKIILSCFLVEWFFKGTENFKYVSIRNMAIKAIYVCSLFILVKTKNDLKIYFYLTVLVVVVNAIINISYASKFVKFKIDGTRVKKYLKPVFNLGVYVLLTSMYTTFNIIYLGISTNNVEVGYYWTALKIYTIILGLYTAFTNVMLPRMSLLLAQNKIKEFQQMISKSFELLLSVSFPIIISSVILAPQIIITLSGKEYNGAIIPMQIIMPLILVVGSAQILAIQVLMPLEKDKTILKASLIGALLSIVLNIILVKEYGSKGTSLVLFISEIAVTAYYIIEIKKLKIIEFPWRLLLKNIAGSLPYVIICYSIQYYLNEPITIIVVSFIIEIAYLAFLQIIIIKNKLIYENFYFLKYN